MEDRLRDKRKREREREKCERMIERVREIENKRDRGQKDR